MDFNVASAAKDHTRKRKIRNKEGEGGETLITEFLRRVRVTPERRENVYVMSALQGYSRKTRRNKEGERRKGLMTGF